MVLLDLQQRLCLTAKELYQWDISFDGTVVERNYWEQQEWISQTRSPKIQLGAYEHPDGQIYGLVNVENPAKIHPIAIVFPGRQRDYQEDLLREVLLRLRKLNPDQPSIRLPPKLSAAVHSYHLTLLNRNNPEIQLIGDAPQMIYAPDEIKRFTASLKISEDPREPLRS